VGVVGLSSERAGPLLTPDQDRLLHALADQAALAIERLALARDVERERVAAETERLRSALLTSISHDLRTPLASILGCADSLKTGREALGEEDQQALIGTIRDEALRLNRLIANLLDMTRVEAGAVVPRTDLVDLGDVVGSALERATNVLAGHRVRIDLAGDLPMLRLDPVLFEQVLFNLFDNAAKYAPSGSAIMLRARRDGDVVRIQILDEGQGILQDDLERVFDKFYRAHAAERRPAGSGLGLPICRGFVTAMGGTIFAGNRQDRQGAVLTIEFPVPADCRSPAEGTR
jgi:two-component system sensor histidine kinase KdpD